MAYLVPQGGKWPKGGETGMFYIYDRLEPKGKPKCVKALGLLTNKEAEHELIKWKADNGKDNVPIADKSIQAVWSEYLAFLIEDGKSWRTVKTYRDDVEPFIAQFSQLKELTPKAVEAWDEKLRKHQWRPGPNSEWRALSKESRAHRLRSIRAFCGWLTKTKKYFKENPFQIDVPEQRKDAKRALSGVEIQRLFLSWPTEKNMLKPGKHELSKLFFGLKFASGMRFSELYGESDEKPGVTHESINRELGFISLGKTKAGTKREVAVDRRILGAIPGGVGPLFWGKISARTLADHLTIAKVKAGISGRLRPHDARVSSATAWARKGMPLKARMDQHGWLTAKQALEYEQIATGERVEMAQDIYD
jgi:site-specific recombinase XerC